MRMDSRHSKMRMDSRHGKMRMNVEADRLSNLPDDIIHKILSFIGIREAIQTSALSSRWRYIWTSMTCLNFSSADFHKEADISKSARHVLSNRNNQVEVSSFKLNHENVSQVFVKRLLEYAVSHNIQQVDITCSPRKKIEFPRSIFSSRSLKHLTLRSCTYEDLIIMTPPTWELQALATLNLQSVTLNDDSTNKCVGLFSNCANLKNLTLISCRLKGLNLFKICHPGLSSLTLDNSFQGVNMDIPQLKNLTIKHCPGIHRISAPNLSSLQYYNYRFPLGLFTDFLLLEKVDICISCPYLEKKFSDSSDESSDSSDDDDSSEDDSDAHKAVCLLQQLHSVKFLTVNSEIITLLSSSVELISHQPSPFVKLKSLKIYPANVPLEQTQPEINMSTEVKNYLLGSSPGATLTVVSHEEIRAVKNIASAHCLMRELQLVLDQLKENSKINTTDRAQPYTKMAHIESYWEDLHHELEKGYKNGGCVISMLRIIEGKLAKLPTSHKAKLQARFSGLCAEADTVMDNVMDHWKIQCDKKPSFINLLQHHNRLLDEL